MILTDFNGILPIRMEEAGADGAAGGTGGGGETALTVTTGTAVATVDDATGADGTALATTEGDAVTGPVFDNGKLSATAAKSFREIEKANPQHREILNKAQRAMGGWAKVTAMLGPKPFDVITRLRKFEKDAGGEQGLAALRASVEDMEKSDELYGKADPMLIEMMTESPAGKNAFVKLWPHTVNKLRELAPMTYTRWLGAQVLNAAQKLEMEIGKDRDGKSVTEPIDMPHRLRRVYSLLPPVDASGKIAGGTMTAQQQADIVADLGLIYSWIESVRGWANATPEDLTPPTEDTSKDLVAKAQREADDALQTAWKVQRDAVCNDLINDEVRKQTKDLGLSSTIIADISARARKSLNDTRRAQPDNQKKIGGFFESKNLNGYIAYNKRIVEDNAQAAVEKAVALYSRKSTRRAPAASGKQQAAAPAAKPGQQQAAAPDASGKVTKLNQQQLDKIGGRFGLTRWMKHSIGGSKGTTPDMLKKGQYVMKGGNPLGLADGSIVQL